MDFDTELDGIFKNSHKATVFQKKEHVDENKHNTVITTTISKDEKKDSNKRRHMLSKNELWDGNSQEVKGKHHVVDKTQLERTIFVGNVPKMVLEKVRLSHISVHI
jgi:uncharacterized membrane protein